MSGIYVPLSLLIGLILLVPGILGIFGALPKNDWVGIRMNVVMRDERTWEAGHRAGGPWLVAAGLVAFMPGIALLLGHPDASGATNIETIGMVGAFLLAGIGAWRAQAAARRLE
jgi:hypothetical protein